MRDEGSIGPEEEEERPRPRVVDKRVSTRGADATEPTEPPSASSAPPTDASPTDASPPADVAPPVDTAPQGAAPPRARELTPEQEAEARQLADDIASAPAASWVANAAITLVNVAAVKIDRGALDEAQMAIDALDGMLSAVGARLGEAETPLRQTLAQLKFAYAEAAKGR